MIVAHSGSDFHWPEPSQTTQTFADIRDDESTLHDQYFTAETKPWLINHWNAQLAKGNGFASAQLSDETQSIPCITKRLPDTYKLSDESKILSGEVIGQGVIVSLFQKIIEATKTVGTVQTHIQNAVAETFRTQLDEPASDMQLGFSFA